MNWIIIDTVEKFIKKKSDFLLYFVIFEHFCSEFHNCVKIIIFICEGRKQTWNKGEGIAMMLVRRGLKGDEREGKKTV